MKYYYIMIYYIRPNINGFFFHLHVSFFFFFLLQLLFFFSTLPSVFQYGTVGRLNVGLSRIISRVDYLYTKCNFLCMILYMFVKGL